MPYCFGEALDDLDEDFSDIEVDYSLPRNMSYDVALLDKLCQRDNDCVLTFYGGEPLICVDKIKQIMDNTRARLFMVQTNGLLLDRLEPEYVNHFHTILVSIDGDEALTDFYRGNGTFKRLISNLKLIRRNGFGVIDSQNDGDGADRHIQAGQMAPAQSRVFILFSALAAERGILEERLLKERFQAVERRKL